MDNGSGIAPYLEDGATYVRELRDNADLVIAATAPRLRILLATLNIRHFPMFPGLEPAYRR